MSSINNLIVRAEKVGRFAADLAHELHKGVAVSPNSNAHHPGDDTGRLALDAYRNHGAEEMKSVVKGYQAGYNARAQELGSDHVRPRAVGTDQERHRLGTARGHRRRTGGNTRRPVSLARCPPTGVSWSTVEA